MRQTGKELGDYYSRAFSKAEGIHADFFEGFMTPEDTAGNLEFARELLLRLEQNMRESIASEQVKKDGDSDTDTGPTDPEPDE